MNVSKVWFVGVLLALGTVFGLDAAGVLDAGPVIGDWWPAAFILAGALQLVFNQPRQWVGPLAVMIIAGLVLARTTGAFDATGPLLLSVGFFVVAIALATQLRRTGRTPPPSIDRVNTFVAFGGTELASHSKHFEGGSVGSIFGGTELDLRDAQLAPGAALDVFTAFGGTEITVPHGWRVEMRGMPLFGGFENATSKDMDLGSDAPVLTVDATVLFGGVEVKH